MEASQEKLLLSGSECCLLKGVWTVVENGSSELSKLSLISLLSFQQQVEYLTDLLIASAVTVSVRYISNKACSVWQLEGSYTNLIAFKTRLEGGHIFDYLLWPELVSNPPELMVFDMDSTFIEIEVIDELAKRHGVGEKVALVTESAMRGEIDFAASLISRVGCLKGLSEEIISDIAAQLPVSQGVELLVAQAHRNHCKIAIVSGGFMPFVSRLQQDLQLYKVHANQLVVERGLLTGEVAAQIVDAQAKADFVLELCEELQLSTNQVMTIGDGANDLIMMKETGFNLAYKAKPKVQAQANGCFNFSHLGMLAAVFNWSE